MPRATCVTRVNHVPPAMPAVLDAYTIQPGSCIVVIGRCGTGKTTLIRDLLTRIRYQHIVAFTPDDSSARMLSEFAPTAHVLEAYDPLVLKQVAEFQRVEISAALRRTKLGGSGARSDRPRSVVCVLDDCLVDKFYMDQTFVNLLLMSRTLLITIVIAMGTIPRLALTFVAPHCDYMFAFRDTTRSLRRDTNTSLRVDLYNKVSGIFESYEEFSDAFDCATREHGGALVLDLTGPPLCWSYRASLTPPSFDAALRVARTPEVEQKHVADGRVDELVGRAATSQTPQATLARIVSASDSSVNR
jgi:energy-coupling factor transporter ATP-binding protein EcfA2